MQIKVRDCGQCIVKSWSSVFTRGLTCVIDHPSQSSFASVMSRLHHLQNSSLLQWEKCQCTGNILTKPYTLWKEHRQWMWRQWQLSDRRTWIPRILHCSEWSHRQSGLGSCGYRGYTLPQLSHRHLLDEEQPALLRRRREVWVLFLYPFFFFPGFIFDIRGKYQCRSSNCK